MKSWISLMLIWISSAELKHNETNSLPPVVWRAPIGCDNSGFFVEIVSYMRGLLPFFKPDRLFLDVGRCTNFDLFTEKDSEMLKSLQLSFAEHPPPVEETVVIYHKLPGQHSPPSLSRSRYLIGRMMSESTILSSTEVHQARVFDEIWVPTKFHAGVFTANGIPSEKIQIIPLPVDISFYSELPKPSRRKVFRFLSVFKHERRKGVDILLSAYWKSFTKEDEVELLIRSYKPQWEPGSTDLNKAFNNIAMKEFGQPMSELASVIWLKHDLSKHELRSLYLSADVFVLPTRGEGWCLPCAEALAAGTPLVVTNFSGPSVYLNNEFSFPIRINPILNADGTGEPDKAHLSKIMLHVVTLDPDELRRKSASARRFSLTNFDPLVIARRVIGRLNDINLIMDKAINIRFSDL